MFSSFSGAEVLTIAVIALVVFGPHRLPEIARTIGGYLRELRGAVIELRKGLEQEIGPLTEPIKEIRQEISKPVSDVRQTLAQTADAAKSAERDLKRSMKNPPGNTSEPPGSADEGSTSNKPESITPDTQGTPGVRWVAPQPPTGVSPKEVWQGMGDPMPDTVHPPEPDEPAPPVTDDEPDASTSRDEDQPKEPAGEQDAP